MRERRTPSGPGAWAKARCISSQQQPEDFPEPTGPISPRYNAPEAMNLAMVIEGV
jgi:hypothetical protein